MLYKKCLVPTLSQQEVNQAISSNSTLYRLNDFYLFIFNLGGGGAYKEWGGPSSSYESGKVQPTAWFACDKNACWAKAYSTSDSANDQGGGGSLTKGGDNTGGCGTNSPSARYQGANGAQAAAQCCGGGGNDLSA